jgi:hypothetical protein
MLDLSRDDLRTRPTASRPPSQGRGVALGRGSAASQIKAITTVLDGSRVNTVAGFGEDAGDACSSLLTAGIAEHAIVYADATAVAAGRERARKMGHGDRVEFVERTTDSALMRTLPEVGMILCLDLPVYAGFQPQEPATGLRAWEASAVEWLEAMRRKCDLCLIGLRFDESTRNQMTIQFPECAKRAGWSLFYDADLRDIDKFGPERANGRYSRGGPLPRQPSPKHPLIEKVLARFSRADSNQNHHLYLLEAEHAALPHIVVVAGASGSGKTTFVDLLREHKLSVEIYRRLPAGVSDWPVVGSSIKPMFPRGAPGIIFQYDMNGRGLSKGRDFCDDPALSDIERASALTVINLRPAPALMIDQLVAREGDGRTKEDVLNTALVWRLLQRFFIFNRMLRRWKPSIERNRRSSFRRKIDLYDQEGWLDGLYARWDAYLRPLVARGAAVEKIFLEPDVNTPIGQSYSWRIASELPKTHGRHGLQEAGQS